MDASLARGDFKGGLLEERLTTVWPYGVVMRL